MISRPHVKRWPSASVRRAFTAAATVGAMATFNGCMTTWFLATDYDDRTEKQWWTAFVGDAAIGGGLVASAYALGNDGQPEWWVLSVGLVSLVGGLLVMPLARYPDALPPKTL